MSKPDWKDAPKWAKFLAKDEDGEWCWFEVRPTLGGAAWHPLGGACITASYDTNWKETLEPRP